MFQGPTCSVIIQLNVISQARVRCLMLLQLGVVKVRLVMTAFRATANASTETCVKSIIVRASQTINKQPHVHQVCYDHMKQKTPDPVRSPQLNCLQLRQYYGERSRGNTGCCSFALFDLIEYFGRRMAIWKVKKSWQMKVFCLPVTRISFFVFFWTVQDSVIIQW